MKRTPLLNRHLSQLVASLGHLDEIVLADAGLPMPDGVPVIDLAVTRGVPAFWDVMAALRSELVIEAACYASEASDELQQQMVDEMARWGTDIKTEMMPHDAFKARTSRAKAVIRTGECTPYCNVILVSGVPF